MKFNAEFKELSLFFLKQQEVAKKWLKLKQSGKMPIGFVQRLSIKRQVKTSRGIPKRVFWSYFDSISFSNAKRLIIKVNLVNLSRSKFSSINPQSAHCLLKIFEKMQAISLYSFVVQQQTSTLRRQKIILLYIKFNTEFNKLSLFF